MEYDPTQLDLSIAPLPEATIQQTYAKENYLASKPLTLADYVVALCCAGLLEEILIHTPEGACVLSSQLPIDAEKPVFAIHLCRQELEQLVSEHPENNEQHFGARAARALEERVPYLKQDIYNICNDDKKLIPAHSAQKSKSSQNPKSSKDSHASDALSDSCTNGSLCERSAGQEGLKVAQTQRAFYQAGGPHCTVGGSLFIAKGSTFKPSYLEAALNAGAHKFIFQDPQLLDLIETWCKTSSQAADTNISPQGLVCVRVSNGHAAEALLSAVRYGFPGKDEQLKRVLITGTKGKTTTSYVVRELLRSYGTASSPTQVAYCTTEQGSDGLNSFDLNNTTPSSFDLQRLLASALSVQTPYAVIETSSQAFRQHRVDYLRRNVSVITNISREHIAAAEHPTVEDYLSSKLHIFDHAECLVVPMNFACPEALRAKILMVKKNHGQSSKTTQNTGLRVIGYGALEDTWTLDLDLVDEVIVGCALSEESQPVQTEHRTPASLQPHMLIGYGSVKPDSFTLLSEPHEYSELAKKELNQIPQASSLLTSQLEVPLTGHGHLCNCLAALAVLHAFGLPAPAKDALSQLKIPGRLNLIPTRYGAKLCGMIDYAYTYDSLKDLANIVKSQFNDYKVFVVIGATGKFKSFDRRIEIGHALPLFADRVFLTEDDSLGEAPEEITQDISSAIDDVNPKLPRCFELPRSRAMERACTEAIRAVEEGQKVLLISSGFGCELKIARNAPGAESYVAYEGDHNIMKRLLA